MGGGRKSVFHNFHLSTSCHKGSAPRSTIQRKHSLLRTSIGLGLPRSTVTLSTTAQMRPRRTSRGRRGQSLQPAQRLPRYCRVTKSSPHAPAVLPGTHLRRTEAADLTVPAPSASGLATACSLPATHIHQEQTEDHILAS